MNQHNPFILPPNYASLDQYITESIMSFLIAAIFCTALLILAWMNVRSKNQIERFVATTVVLVGVIAIWVVFYIGCTAIRSPYFQF